MSRRTIILYLVFVVLAITIFMTVAWPFLHVEDYLREFLLKQLSPSFTGAVELRRVAPGFGTLTLFGFGLQDSSETWSVKADQIQIRFSLIRFVTSRFSILQSVADVSVRNPAVSFRLMQGRSFAASDESPDTLRWKTIEDLPSALWIENLRLDSGTLRILTAEGEPLVTLRDLNGGLQSDKPGELKAHLSMGLKQARTAESDLSVSLDAANRTMEASFNTKLKNIKAGRELGLPDPLNLLADSLDVRLRLWIQDQVNGLEGEIRLSDFRFNSADQTILRSDSIRILVGNWELTIPPARAEGLAANWTIEGLIPDLRRPTWDLRIQANSREASQIVEWLKSDIKIKPKGRLTFSALVKGDLTHPRLQFDGNLSELRTQLDLFTNVRFSGKLEDDRFELAYLKGTSSNGDVSFQGSLLFTNEGARTKGILKWQGAIPGLKGSLPGSLTATISGDSGGYVLDGRWESQLRATVPADLHLTYSLLEDQLKADFLIPGTTSKMTVELDSLSSRIIYHFRFDEPVDILKNFYDWQGWHYVENLHFGGELGGPLERMECRLDLYRGELLSHLSLDGVLITNKEGGAAFNGDVLLQAGQNLPMQGKIGFDWNQGILSLKTLELDSAIFAQGVINSSTGEIGPSDLRVSNWSVSRGVAFLSPDLAAQMDGILDGRMDFYGTLDNPSISLNLYASRGHFQERKDLWAVISAQIENQVLSVGECNIGQGPLSLFRLKGSAAQDGSKLDFQLSSEQADVSDFLNLLGSNPLKLSGQLKLNANLTGSIKQPDLRLSLSVPYGSIYKIPFEQLNASVLMDSTTSGKMVLKDFSLTQSPDLSLEGDGILPFGDTSMDLRFHLKGNVLKIPRQIESSILLSEGQGELFLELKQIENHISLQNASLEIHDGIMRFPEVVNEIKAIQAKFRIEGNQLRIQKLTGEISGQSFSVFNRFDSTLVSGNVESLYFPQVDLDCGVVVLEAKGRGLRARIPALMVKGVEGNFRFYGKSGEDNFIIAGPIQRPLIRGAIRISGATVTYPFPPSSGSPSRFVRGVLAVLSSARWDVNVIPERDNHYVRQISGLENTTFIKGVSELLTAVDVDVIVNPGDSYLNVLGSMDEGNFRFLGQLISTRGSIEYLDLKFRVDRFSAEFDEHDPLPWVQGRGQTVYIDSLGVSRNIYLTLYVVDPITGERSRRGRWGDFTFVLKDDAGSSQEQILAALGYSPERITNKVTTLGGTIISDAMLRSIIRPLERELENMLQMDLIRLQPTIAQHIYEAEILGINPGLESQVDWGAYFLRQSQLTVGKYISNDLFLTYTGMWESGINAENERRFGFLHQWNLEYRIRPVSNNFILNLGYEYDSLERLGDKEVLFRYSLIF